MEQVSRLRSPDRWKLNPVAALYAARAHLRGGDWFILVPVALVMGKPEASVWTERFAGGLRSAVETPGEEELGLVQNVDGGEDGMEEDGAEPPPYEEPVETKEGEDVKEGN